MLKNKLMHPSKTSTWIRNVQKKNNLREISTHGLRHTHCSLLFEANVSIQDVQDRLGHKDVQTTMNIYTHVTQNADVARRQNLQSRYRSGLSIKPFPR